MLEDDLALCLQIMRRQRHDFLNHLQVLSGLIQLNRPEQAMRYIKKSSYQIEHMGGILHLRCPRIAVCLLRLALEAQKVDIQVYCGCSTDLSGLLKADEEKLTAILDGICQLVITALAELPSDKERSLAVCLEEKEGNYLFSWEVPAIHLRQLPDWQEAFSRFAVLASEMGGDMSYLRQDDSRVLELRLAVQPGV